MYPSQPTGFRPAQAPLAAKPSAANHTYNSTHPPQLKNSHGTPYGQTYPQQGNYGAAYNSAARPNVPQQIVPPTNQYIQPGHPTPIINQPSIVNPPPPHAPYYNGYSNHQQSPANVQQTSDYNRVTQQQQYPQYPPQSSVSQPPQQNYPTHPQQMPYQNVNQMNQGFQNLSVNKSWNQMWGSESVNLLTEKNIKSRIAVKQPVEDDGACDHDVMCCTLRKVPETASVLQKSRLPFGILIHPFKDDEVCCCRSFDCC